MSCSKFLRNLQKAQAKRAAHMRAMMQGAHVRALEIDHVREMITLVVWT